MKIYFIRHGESEWNARGLHQHEGIPLSTKGEDQTVQLAKRFLKIQVDRIVASPFERTKQTAEAISSLINKPIDYNTIFREVKRPTSVIGKSYTDSEALSIRNLMSENFEEEDWHHSDEENFFDFKNRGLEALKFLESLNDKNVLVVSHSEMIKMVIALMMFGDKLLPVEFLSVANFFRTSNTGITVCEYKKSKWDMYTWNDHAHLG